MNREQVLIGLVLSVPPGVGVVSAIHLSAPSMLPTAIGAGLFTFGTIFGLVYLAVEYNPEMDDDVAYDADWPGFEENDDEAADEEGDAEAEADAA